MAIWTKENDSVLNKTYYFACLIYELFHIDPKEKSKI